MNNLNEMIKKLDNMIGLLLDISICLGIFKNRLRFIIFVIVVEVDGFIIEYNFINIIFGHFG